MSVEDLPLSPGIFGQMGNDLMPRIMEELLPDQGDVGAVEALPWLVVTSGAILQNSVSDLSWTMLKFAMLLVFNVCSTYT